VLYAIRCVRRSRIANTQMRCKDTAFSRIVQVFYAICPIFLLSYRDDIGEERLPCAGTAQSMGSNLTKGLSVYNKRGIYAPWIFYLSFSCQTCLLRGHYPLYAHQKIHFDGRYMDTLRSPSKLKFVGPPVQRT